MMCFYDKCDISIYVYIYIYIIYTIYVYPSYMQQNKIPQAVCDVFISMV